MAARVGKNSLTGGHPPEEARAYVRNSVASSAGPPIPMAELLEFDIQGPAGPLKARLYVPHGAPPPPRPMLIHFHGGGWMTGDLQTHDGPCRFLAAHSGASVLSTTYRLAPEHPFPAAVETRRPPTAGPSRSPGSSAWTRGEFRGRRRLRRRQPGPPVSRIDMHVPAARLAPAESPPTAIRPGSAPSSAACSMRPGEGCQRRLRRRRGRGARAPGGSRREHRAAAMLGEEAAGAVVGLEVADHPATAVVVDEQRVRRARRAEGHVEARRHLPAGPGISNSSSPPSACGGRGQRPPGSAVPAPAPGGPPGQRGLAGRAATPAARGCRLASSCPSSRGGRPKSRRCTRGESPQSRVDDPRLRRTAGGGAGRATREPGYRCRVMHHTHMPAAPVYRACERRMEAATTTTRAGTHRAGDGLPPSPRMGRPLQTAIWSRQAQWHALAVPGPLGDMFTLSIAYEGTWVLLSDPEAIKQVFTGDPRVFHAGEGNQILAPDPRRELGPRARREAAHEPAQAAAAALPRRAHAGLRARR